jgi:hypothetical protein
METPRRDYSMLRRDHARIALARDLNDAAAEVGLHAPAPSATPDRSLEPEPQAEVGLTHGPADYLDHVVSALDRLDRYIEEQKNPAAATEHSAARAALKRHIEERTALDPGEAPELSAAERSAGLERPHRNYSVLKDELARQPEATAERSDADDAEPSRPADLPHRTPGWTSSGRMDAHEASALAWVKAGRQRQARETLDRHIEETRSGRDADTPEADPSNAELDPRPGRGDGGMER